MIKMSFGLRKITGIFFNGEVYLKTILSQQHPPKEKNNPTTQQSVFAL